MQTVRSSLKRFESRMHLRDQFRYVLRCRLAAQSADTSCLFNTTGPHYSDCVGKAGRLGQIVRNKHSGNTKLAAQRVEYFV
jgi:hypothetical protein